MRKIVVLAALLAALFVPILTAAPASADAGYTIGFTAGLGAYPRSSPNYAARVGTALPEGAPITATCWTRGESITNPDGYTSDVWIQDTAGYFWAEPWVNTGSYGVPTQIPQCGTAPAATLSPTAAYQRSAATSWALAHAEDTPPWEGTVASCTWFVSQALWAGGLPQDGTWNGRDNGYGDTRPVNGTQTAWNVDLLVDYLQSHYDITAVDLTDNFTTNAVPQAQIGDVMVYHWGTGGDDGHLAFVTNIAPGSYPEVSEWGTGKWFGGWGPTGYWKRGWTYSNNNGEWLQAKYPNVRATLLHFNGGLIAPTF